MTPATNPQAAIKSDETEISSSTRRYIASILENDASINGSSQNTFMLDVVEPALERNVFIEDYDFEPDQTEMRFVFVDILVGTEIKPVADE